MNEEQSLDSVTVVELQTMCKEIVAKRAVVDEAEAIYKRLSKECDELEMKLINTLTDLKMKSFRSEDDGVLLGIKETFQLATPKGADKEVFYSYLKEIGHFDALATVHARTLASWYNQENEAAIARGEPFASIPGLELPTKRLSLFVRKK